MQTVPLVGGPLSIEGAVGLRRGEGYVRPWRLPPEDLDLHHPALAFMASLPAGVRLRLATTSSTVALDVDHVVIPEVDLPSLPKYDLTIESEVVASEVATCLERNRIVFSDLGTRHKVIEVWLPVFPGVRLRGVEVDDGATIEPAPDGRPRWLTYGSSITHGFEAHSPSRTWPATAARQLDWHLTSLGYAGMCHLDPLVARMMAALPADRISLKVGINVHNLATLRERTFAPLVHGFLSALRDGHPGIPICLISPIFSPEREDSGMTVIGEDIVRSDLTLRRMRVILHDVVDVRRRRGDTELTYLDGTELFGPDDVDHLPDGLHPDGDGYELIGHRFASYMADR